MSGGGGDAGLPFLEIDPPERLFELMADPGVHGNAYRSRLFGRAVRVEFGLDPEFADNLGDPIEGCMAWAKISSDDARCPVINVGIDANGNCIGEDNHYFDAGLTCYKSDEFPWSGVDRETVLELILRDVRDTMTHGFYEYWRGLSSDGDGKDSKLYGNPSSGPLRDQDRSRGWLRRAIEREMRADEGTKSGEPDSWLRKYTGYLLAIGLAIIFLPIMLSFAVLQGITDLFRSHRPHARRYPPFPMD